MTDKFNQDGSVNENWLAVEITRREEGIEEVNIAQIKEILKVTLDILAELTKEGHEDEGRGKVDGLFAKHEESEWTKS